jgi:hypothetical protein
MPATDMLAFLFGKNCQFLLLAQFLKKRKQPYFNNNKK